MQQHQPLLLSAWPNVGESTNKISGIATTGNRVQVNVRFIVHQQNSCILLQSFCAAYSFTVLVCAIANVHVYWWPSWPTVTSNHQVHGDVYGQVDCAGPLHTYIGEEQMFTTRILLLWSVQCLVCTYSHIFLHNTVKYNWVGSDMKSLIAKGRWPLIPWWTTLCAAIEVLFYDLLHLTLGVQYHLLPCLYYQSAVTAMYSQLPLRAFLFRQLMLL